MRRKAYAKHGTLLLLPDFARGDSAETACGPGSPDVDNGADLTGRKRKSFGLPKGATHDLGGLPKANDPSLTFKRR